MRAGIWVAIAILAARCAPASREPAGGSTTDPQTSVMLHNHSLVVHLAAAPTRASGPLVLYVSGDGGWASDQAFFRHIVSWGYPAAGIGAPDYTSHLGAPNGKVEPHQLADDYFAIIDAARRALTLAPGTRVVLVGLSRGSGLNVAAATDPRLHTALRGVLAVALTAEEEFVEERERAESPGVMLQTYPAIPRLGRVPLAVIQSTRDEYLAAEAAQRLFGPDAPGRRFRAIDAADHGFGGRIAELYKEMRNSFDWIMEAQAIATTAPQTTPPTVAMVRSDGVVVPFAEYSDRRWATPHVSRYDRSDADSPDISDQSAPWFESRLVAALAWTMFAPAMPPRALTLGELVSVESHCTKVWGLRSDAPAEPFSRSDGPRRLGLAASNGLTIDPMPSVPLSSDIATRILTALRPAFDREEGKGSTIPLTLDELARLNLPANGGSLYRFQISRTYPPRSAQCQPDRRSVFTGWVKDNAGAIATIQTHFEIQDCGEKQGTSTTPLGVTTVDGRTFIITSEHYYEGEAFVILEWTGREIVRRLKVYAGGC